MPLLGEPLTKTAQSTATVATDLQHPLKGAQGGDKDDALCAVRKTGRTDLEITIFRRFYEPKFLHLLYLERHRDC